MDNPDPLSELADIHLPEPVSQLPQAPGWWMLWIVLALVSFFVVRRVLIARRKNRLKRFALAELDKCLASYKAQLANKQDEQAALTLNYVSEVNAVLRRVALKHYPYGRIASLSGEDWVSFLRNAGDASLMDDAIASAIVQGRFAKEWDIDADALYKMAHHWISSLYLDKASPKTSNSTSTDEKATS
ncbi:MAG: DUF4381 domain-containing protein [Pseudohongiellaceae bacterium]|nr:DUF4381 domain-containing protein [Pseudohongiellaceae bacterium]